MLSQDKQVLARKSKVLIDIAISGEKVEETIAENANELDFIAVRLWEKRIEAAYK
jgi:hypothetical protein